MDRTYRVTFKDGSVEVVKAPNEQHARMRARGKRPFGRRAEPISHATLDAGWTCRHCRTVNSAEATVCKQCRVTKEPGKPSLL